MIAAKADKVFIEDIQHKFWVVYAKNGPVTHQRKTFKTYNNALHHATKLQHYYQVGDVTEITR